MPRFLLHKLKGQSGFHILYMAFDFNLAPDMNDFTFFVDEEGGAFDAHVFFAVEVFFFPCAVVFANRAVFIRGEGEV